MSKRAALGKGLGAIFKDDTRSLKKNPELNEETNNTEDIELHCGESEQLNFQQSKTASENGKISENSQQKPVSQTDNTNAILWIDAEKTENNQQNFSNNDAAQLELNLFGNETVNDVQQNRNTDSIDKTSENVSRETFVKTALIEPNPNQPRKKFDEAALQELADSMKTYGILQPLLVRQNGMLYEIIAGERRWRAARLAGIKEIPVIIRNFQNQQAAEIAIIENIQREDLGPVEEARAYRALIDTYGMTQEEVADKVGKNRTTITNSMRLLQLCDAVLQLLSEEKLTAGHARCLIAVESAEEQEKLANEIVENKLSVRETEKLLKAYQKAKKEADAKQDEREEELNMYLIDLARKLTGSIGTKVKIKQGAKGRGKIEIDYYNEDDLNKIVEKLR